MVGADTAGEGAPDLGHGGILVFRLDGGDQGLRAVSRPLLAVGIGVFPEGIVAEVADDLDQLVEVLRERSANPAPDARARDFVERNYVWQASAAKLNRVLRGAAREQLTCSP